MLVLELGEEAGDAVRGDGKGDASCNLECVDADDLTVLSRVSRVWGLLGGMQAKPPTAAELGVRALFPEAETAISAPLRCPKQPRATLERWLSRSHWGQ